MDSADVEVLATALEWQQAGLSAMLATVVHTWGSAPRPIGSLLAIRSDGVLKGSVSGGCIEVDLAERARSGQLQALRPQLIRYGVTAEEAHRFGLPCGGSLDLVIERISAMSAIDKLLAAASKGESVLRTLDTMTGDVALDAAVTVVTIFDGRLLRLAMGPQLRAVLIGAGQLSEYVARLLVPLGYQVIVCDPRSEHAAIWSVDKTELSREMPDDLLIRIGIDSGTAVLALTHDPKLDDLALIEALKSDAFYVGAIGSRASSIRRKERMMLFDVTEDETRRLRAPIGMHIGAQTPMEIAVSIVAEMTAVRRHVRVLQSHAMRDLEPTDSSEISAT